METIKLISPVDGSLHAERPVASEAEINAITERAKTAQIGWAETPLA